MLLDHHPYVLKVDDLEIRLKLARFSIDQHAAFSKLQERQERAQRRLERMRDRLIAKGEGGKPTETATDLRIRLEEEHPEEAKRYEAALDELDAAHAAFMEHTFTRHVVVEPGQFPGIEGEKDGGILLRFWGARGAILGDVVGALITVNMAGPKGLELFASLSASGLSSIAPNPDPAGPAPVPTAAPADANSSASPEGATASTGDGSSGTTATSS
jgi:hypothetical protein